MKRGWRSTRNKYWLGGEMKASDTLEGFVLKVWLTRSDCERFFCFFLFDVILLNFFSKSSGNMR